jgi:hypothetical protein
MVVVEELELEEQEALLSAGGEITRARLPLLATLFS